MIGNGKTDLVVGHSFDILSSSVPILLVATVSKDIRRDSEERQFFFERRDALLARVMRPSRPAVQFPRN